MLRILLFVAVGLVALLLVLGRVPLSYNLRNLTVRWRTTALTALAFTLVIALLTVMLAFVNGMRRLTEGTGRPGNVLVLAESATDEAFSTLNTADLAEIETQPEVLRDRRGRPLASRETYLVINQPIPDAPPGSPKRRFLQVRGIADPAPAAAVHDLRLLPGGTWFSPAGVQPLPGEEAKADARSAIQAVIGEGVARELARDRTPAQRAAARHPDRLDVGDTFLLGNRVWIIVGLMESSGSFNSEVWAKQSLVAPIVGKDTFTTLVVRTADDVTARRLRDFLNGKPAGEPLPAGGPVRSRFKKVSVSAHVETDYYATLAQGNQQFLFAIVFVTVVIAIGGVFGVMNTMFAAVSQRIKDIGVLRLVGYSRRQILVSFLLESVILGLAGGLAGCLLGTLADGWTATSIVGSHQGGGKFVVLKLVVDARILGVGLLLTLAMGILGGVLPALSAMRLRALEALR